MQHSHVGLLGTVFAGISFGASVPGDWGIGGISVDVPNLNWLKDKAHHALAGGYAMFGVDVGLGPGYTFGNTLYMGYGKGTGNGAGVGEGGGISVSALVGVSLPIFGFTVEESTARGFRFLVSLTDPATYSNAMKMFNDRLNSL